MTEARRNPKQPSYLRRAGDYCTIKEAHIIAIEVAKQQRLTRRVLSAIGRALRWWVS